MNKKSQEEPIAVVEIHANRGVHRKVAAGS